MNPEIQRLFDIIDTPTDDPSGPSGRANIAFILEINHSHDRNHIMYDSLLTPEQRKIILSPDEQAEIVRELMKRVENGHPFSFSLMWATGKAPGALSTTLIQDYFLRRYREMDVELIYQTLIALDNSLDKDYPQKIRFDELRPMFEWLIRTYPNDRFGTVAEHSQGMLDWFDNDDYWHGKGE